MGAGNPTHPGFCSLFFKFRPCSFCANLRLLYQKASSTRKLRSAGPEEVQERERERSRSSGKLFQELGLLVQRPEMAWLADFLFVCLFLSESCRSAYRSGEWGGCNLDRFRKPRQGGARDPSGLHPGTGSCREWRYMAM